MQKNEHGDVELKVSISSSYLISSFRFFISSVAAISTSRCEFTQFVTNHFVGNKDWNVLTTIMDSDGQNDHVRKDR